ncbi:hypothetical protein ACVILL_007688 [Bradyrhizobium sp. USDA 3364]
MDDLLQGVMADLAIVIHGTDTATLHDLADQLARVASNVPGAADVQARQRLAGPICASSSIAMPSPVMGSTRPKCSIWSKRWVDAL